MKLHVQLQSTTAFAVFDNISTNKLNSCKPDTLNNMNASRRINSIPLKCQIEELVALSDSVLGVAFEKVVEDWLGKDWMFPNGAQVGFWMILSLAVIAPLVAIWRNCSALALLFAQVSTSNHPRAKELAPMVETGLKALVAGLLVIWLIAIVPAEDTARWLLIASAGGGALAVVVLRRRLIYWHCVLEVELKNTIEVSETKMTSTTAPRSSVRPSTSVER